MGETFRPKMSMWATPLLRNPCYATVYERSSSDTLNSMKLPMGGGEFLTIRGIDSEKIDPSDNINQDLKTQHFLKLLHA